MRRRLGSQGSGSSLRLPGANGSFNKDTIGGSKGRDGSESPSVDGIISGSFSRISSFELGKAAIPKPPQPADAANGEEDVCKRSLLAVLESITQNVPCLLAAPRFLRLPMCCQH